MRMVAAVAIGWTLLVLAVLLLTPTLMSAPPCASTTEPTPGCEILNAAGSRFVWETQGRPIALLSIGGYVAIAVLALEVRRRR